MSNEANSRPTKSQRREQARADAKAARAKQQAKEKRNRRLLQGGVALAILAVIAIVAVVITTSMRPIGPGPKNMASGGAVFGADLVVQETPALKDGADLVPTKVDREKAPLDIVVYQDYMCPFCGRFDALAKVLIGRVEVLEAKIVSGESTASALAVTSALIFGSSNTASTTMSAPFRSL